jgi:hypothetical protein
LTFERDVAIGGKVEDDAIATASSRRFDEPITLAHEESATSVAPSLFATSASDAPLDGRTANADVVGLMMLSAKSLMEETTRATAPLSLVPSLVFAVGTVRLIELGTLSEDTLDDVGRGAPGDEVVKVFEMLPVIM